MSFFTLKRPEAKKIEIFPKFQRWMKKTNIFKCKPPEVHFTIKNRVPYDELLTNRACSGCTGEYWPSVVFVRTERSEVRTVTTSGQYSPVRPSHLFSNRLSSFVANMKLFIATCFLALSICRLRQFESVCEIISNMAVFSPCFSLGF